MDMFDLFSFDDDKKEDKRAKSSKSAETKAKTPKIKKYKLPLILNMDGIKAEIEQSEIGAEEATEQEILEAVEKKWNWCPADICCLEIEEKLNEAFLTYKQAGSPKGVLTVEDGDCFMFHDHEIDFKEHVDEEEGNIEIPKLQELFKEMFPDYYAENSEEWNRISMLRSVAAGVIVPILPRNHVETVPVQEPLSFLTAKCKIAVTREEQIGIITSQLEEGTDIEKEELSAADVELILKDKGLEYDGRLEISETGTAGAYSLWLKVPEQKKAAIKETMYPVKGVTVSLYYKRYELSPEDFEGKEEITKDELVAFLVRNNHPEYKYSDPRVTYFKKEKTILVTTGGSTKGAGRTSVWDMGHFAERPEEVAYEQIQTSFFTAALTEDREAPDFFSWHLPKIPLHIMAQGEELGKEVYMKYGTEVSLDLYFSQSKNLYFWNLPAQAAERGSVSTETEEFLEASFLSGLIKIGQGHSHGAYRAFFSGQDNVDEVQPGLYFVWGSFDEKHDAHPTFSMRVCLGSGKFLSICPEFVFEPEARKNRGNNGIEELLELACEKLNSSKEEPAYQVAFYNDLELLYIPSPKAYTRWVYSLCSNIFVYDLYEESEKGIAADNWRGYSDGFIISAQPFDEKSLGRHMQIYRHNEKKTIMQYIVDNQDI